MRGATFARTAEVPAQITETESPRPTGGRKRDLLGCSECNSCVKSRGSRRNPLLSKLPYFPQPVTRGPAFPEARVREGKSRRRKKASSPQVYRFVWAVWENYASTFGLICLTFDGAPRLRENVSIEHCIAMNYVNREETRLKISTREGRYSEPLPKILPPCSGRKLNFNLSAKNVVTVHRTQVGRQTDRAHWKAYLRFPTEISFVKAPTEFNEL